MPTRSAATASSTSRAVHPYRAAASGRGTTSCIGTAGGASTRTSVAPRTPSSDRTIASAVSRTTARSSPYTLRSTSVTEPPTSSLKRIWMGCVNS